MSNAGLVWQQISLGKVEQQLGLMLTLHVVSVFHTVLHNVTHEVPAVLHAQHGCCQSAVRVFAKISQYPELYFHHPSSLNERRSGQQKLTSCHA
jgi:hypothetical protein